MNNFTTLGDHQHTEHPLGGPSNQHYGYDDLYRLIEARGQFQGNPEDKRNYTLAMAYDGNPQRQGRCRAAGHPRRTPCGYNITRKTQKDIETQLDKVEDGKHLGPHTEIHEETTYNWAYQYTGSHPHAPTRIGRRIYTYDLNGNQLGWTYPHEEHHDPSTSSGQAEGSSSGSGQGGKDKNTAKDSGNNKNANAQTPVAAAGTGHVSGPGRHLLWDEENRLMAYEDEEHSTRYTYDDKGERIFKKGREGFTFYLNQYYIVRNDALISKHLFAGQSRIVTRMVEPKDDSSSSGQSSDGQSGSGKGSKSGDDDVHRDKLYYYHSDHLGSTGYTTNRRGRVNEHHEYFPFGETWIEEEGDSKRPMYLFTGKELDQESGLYYFGARYYDPRTSVWQSADPILGKYLPTGNKEKDAKLPGLGGVFNSMSLGLYTYSQSRPIIARDPDGNDLIIEVTAVAVGSSYVNSRTSSEKQADAAANHNVNIKTPASLYNVKVFSDSGETATFSVTRIAARDRDGSGKTKDETFTGHGMFQGAIREDGSKGARIELRDFLNPNDSKVKGADGSDHTNIQIHIGPGASEGCSLIPGGEAGRDDVMGTIQGMLNQDKNSGFGDKIFINLEPLPPVGPPAP